MVVVAVRLHLDVLPERGEAQRMRHPHVVQQSIFCGCCVDAIWPEALQSQKLFSMQITFHVIKLPERSEAQRMGQQHVMEQSVLCGCSVDAIQPEALQSQKRHGTLSPCHGRASSIACS